ncbi:hypothetical protein DM02DRAFT_662608 [Periconia macrospinosa]|uniref:Uncharacterized protein n=1 Tax=Periconia macrospinosa TaxID=97972 RepID=A0A2V1D433_9PLEO|nr:hypothetical protein DM02DRAFT_662608 [Periconia macrospinosa]
MPAPWVMFDSVASYDGNCDAGAEPDIAGVGVVVSFVIASFMTTTASILAMLLDQAFDAKGHFTIRAPIRYIRERLIDTAWKKDYAWRPFLDPLIIGLGDQQLVTGYAVLLSAWIKVAQNSLEVQGAHFVLILYICALSSSSHLAALITLRKYLQRYKLIAKIRITLVILFTVCLFASMMAAIAMPETVTVSSTGVLERDMRVRRLSFVVPMAFMLLGFSTALVAIVYTPADNRSPTLLARRASGGRSLAMFSPPPRRGSIECPVHRACLRPILVVFLNPLVAFIIQIVLATLSVILVLSQKFSVPEEPGKWCGLQGAKENEWGFGQTLSVAMLLLPTMGAFQAILEARREIVQ